jgi:hypothetical protein
MHKNSTVKIFKNAQYTWRIWTPYEVGGNIFDLHVAYFILLFKILILFLWLVIYNTNALFSVRRLKDIMKKKVTSTPYYFIHIRRPNVPPQIIEVLYIHLPVLVAEVHGNPGVGRGQTFPTHQENYDSQTYRQWKRMVNSNHH